MAKEPGRNEPCPCGSGDKYKNCCEGKEQSIFTSTWAIAGIATAVVIGLILLAIAVNSGGTPDCPPGTVWSDAHQHCH